MWAAWGRFGAIMSALETKTKSHAFPKGREAVQYRGKEARLKPRSDAKDMFKRFSIDLETAGRVKSVVVESVFHSN